MRDLFASSIVIVVLLLAIITFVGLQGTHFLALVVIDALLALILVGYSLLLSGKSRSAVFRKIMVGVSCLLVCLLAALVVFALFFYISFSNYQF